MRLSIPVVSFGALAWASAGCDAIVGIDDHQLASQNGSVTDATTAIGAGDEPADAGSPNTMGRVDGSPGTIGSNSMASYDAAERDSTDGDAGIDASSGGGQDAGDEASRCPSDIHNCGACGHDCALLPNTTAPTCNSGKCSYQCAAGHVDCADAGTGCVDTLTASPNCGSCGATCSGTTPNCSPAGDAGSHACVASCAASMGAACGSCAGTVKCDGSCSVATPTNYGAACGSCGGTVKCNGSCSVATPSNYGAACGSCGGTVKCDSSCSVATPSSYGAGCGSCGGTVKCDSSCSVATPSNYGAACGSCGSSVLCDGTCSVPAGGTVTLASGTLVAAASRANSTTLSISCPGTITSVTTWSDGGSITSVFKHVDSTNFGWVQGTSPLTAPAFQVTSTDIQAGAVWTFFVTSNDSVDHTVSYTITSSN